jgi:very-short-patch-repair endonuclease
MRPESLHRDRARRLRRDQTDPERILWRHLRAHRLGGITFKRQVVIGPFIVDFCATERRLIIELDGSQHADNIGADSQRTHYLRVLNFRVVRFWNFEIFESLDSVLERIKHAANSVDS